MILLANYFWQRNGLANRQEITFRWGKTNRFFYRSDFANKINIGDIKSSWQALHDQVIELPDADELEAIYSQLQQVADQEGRSLWSVSTLVGTGAVQAGIKLGQVYIFEYYRAVLPTILTEGLYPYSQRVARPYLAEMMCHFDALRVTFTERLWRRVTKRVA